MPGIAKYTAGQVRDQGAAASYMGWLAPVLSREDASCQHRAPRCGERSTVGGWPYLARYNASAATSLGSPSRPMDWQERHVVLPDVQGIKRISYFDGGGAEKFERCR